MAKDGISLEFENTGTTLLEPMILMRIGADEELAGKLIKDILAMRGTFDSPIISAGRLMMEARVPAATSLQYPTDFAILTGGRGSLSMQPDGFEPCPLELGSTARRRGIDPRERSKWILHCRSAL